MKARIAATILFIAAACGVSQPALAPDSFTTGLRLFNSGEWQKAADELLKAVSQTSDDVVVRLTAGVALANLKRYPEAAEQFRSAERLSPQGILPPLLLDATCAEIGQIAESRRARAKANDMLSAGSAFGTPASSDWQLIDSLARHPENAIAHLLLGDLYQLQGKSALAKAEYAESRRLSPGWVKPVFNLGIANLTDDPKAARADFDDVLKMDPSNSRAYLWRGDASLQMGRLQEAIEDYRAAGNDSALAAEAFTRIGNARLRMGDSKAASEAFDMAVVQAPQDARPFVGKAQALQEAGNLQEAEKWYNVAADVLETNQAQPASQAVVQNRMALVKSGLGKSEEAVRSLKRSFELDPSLQNGRLLVRVQSEQNILRQGIAEYEAVLREDPRNIAAMRYLLSAYRTAGHLLGVADMAARLVKADPTGAHRYYCELAEAQMSAGSVSEAIETYLRAFEAGDATTWAGTARSAADSGALGLLRERCESRINSASGARAMLVLFEVQSAQKDSAGMLETAQKLVKLNPDQATYWLRLGEAYEAAGANELAAAVYRKIASGSDPESAAAAGARLRAVSK